MPRRCSICVHPNRTALERSFVEGASERQIAKQAKQSPAAVHRHLVAHLPARLLPDAPARLSRDRVGDEFRSFLTELLDKSRRLLEEAEAAKDYRTAVSALRELRESVELWARAHGQLQPGSTVNVTAVSVNVPAGDMRLALQAALEDLPEIEAEVVGEEEP